MRMRFGRESASPSLAEGAPCAGLGSRAGTPRGLRSPEDVLAADILGEGLFDGVVEIEESDCEGGVAVVVGVGAHDLAAQDERARPERNEARRQGELEGDGAARLEA